DFHVTGVQTCALPILASAAKDLASAACLSRLPEVSQCGSVVVVGRSLGAGMARLVQKATTDLVDMALSRILEGVERGPEREVMRSEERRVGKGGRGRW